MRSPRPQIHTETCNMCKGVYVPIQADGSPYVHVCPPPPEEEEEING